MEEQRRILFVIDSLGCGGAEKSLVSLLRLLCHKKKYEIHLWMLSRGGVFESLLPKDVIIEPTPSYRWIDGLKRHLAQIIYSLTYRYNRLIGKPEHGAETLWKCMSWAYKVPQTEFDVAIAYQQGVPTYLVVSKIRAHKKIAWINADIFSAGYNLKFNAQFYKECDYIVSVSSDLETILDKKYPTFKDKYRIVYDILNPEVIWRQAREPFQEQDIFNEGFTLVTTGRLALPKNHLLAVEAARILNERGCRFRWFFIGEGDERSNIELLIKKYDLHQKVLLLGLRTNPYPYMANCTVYVQTSSFEGFGLTIAEAKILGKPVVSTNFDVVHDQLVHGKNGLIAEMTPESVAENIIRLLEDTGLRNHIIDNLKNESNTTCLTEVAKVEQLLDAN